MENTLKGMVHLIGVDAITMNPITKRLLVKHVVNGQEMYEVEALRCLMPTDKLNKVLAEHTSVMVSSSDVKPYAPVTDLKPGDNVRMKSATLYGENEGVVENTSMMLKALDMHAFRQGLEIFEEDGLCIDSAHAEEGVLPKEYDGVYLKIDYGKNMGGVRVYKAYSHSVTVRTPNMLTSYPAHAITKKN